jgi:membrane protein
VKLPELEPKVLFLFIRDLVRQFIANQGILNASALTYTTLFAVVPLVTVSYAMLAAIPNFQGVGETVQAWVLENFVPATGEVVHTYLQDFTAQARRLTAIGVLFLIITSIMMMKNIEAALNRIWRVQEPRRGISSFLLYWAVLSLGPLLVGLGLVVTSYITALPAFTSASEVVGPGRLFASLPILFSAIAFMLLYAAVPNCRVPLAAAAIGGIAAALMFELAKRSFAFFVTQFPSYELIYGAFAAVPMFLAWIFISWVIILLGAELSRALAVYSFKQRLRDEPPLVTLLSVLNQLWQAQRQGRACSDLDIIKAQPGLNQSRWDAYQQPLLQAKIMQRNAQGRYLLARDLNDFTLLDLVRALPWPMPQSYPTLADAPPWLLASIQHLESIQSYAEDAMQQPLVSLFKREEFQAA